MKKAGIFLLVLVAILAVGGLLAGKFLGGYLTPDLLVRQIESEFGCRAEIDSVDVSLMGAAHVTISGASLGPRDKYVEDKTPLAERLPMEKRDIRVKSASLQVKLMDLIKKRLYVDHLTLDGIDVRVRLRKDGSSNIDDLFSQVGKGKLGSDEKPSKEAKEEFDAETIPMAVKASRVEVINSRFALDVEASGARVVLQNAGFGFSDIDIDPENLASHNQAKFQFSGNISMGGRDEKAPRIFEAKLSGAGEIQPFDPVTAKWDPGWKSTIVLARGSKLDTVPILSKMRAALASVNQFGLDLSGLLINGELAEDARTEISHKRGRYQFEQPLLLDFVNTKIDLHAGSWLNAATNQHEIRGAVTASEQFTKEIQTKVDAYLSKQVSAKLSGTLVQTLFLPITKDGRVHLEVVSSGDLSNPRADIVTPVGTIGNIGDLLKQSGSTGDDLLKVGKGLLDGFFKKK